MPTSYHVISFPPQSPTVPGVLIVGESTVNNKGRRTGLIIRQAEWISEPGAASLPRTAQAIRWAQGVAGEDERWDAPNSPDRRPEGSAVSLHLIINNWSTGYDQMISDGWRVDYPIRVVAGDEDLGPPSGGEWTPDWRVGRQRLIDISRDGLINLELALPVKPLDEHPEIVSHQDLSKALSEAMSRPRNEDLESETKGIPDRYENLLMGVGVFLAVAPDKQGWGSGPLPYPPDYFKSVI